ncbi:ABC transporter ATP-binding protein [Acetivibrio straminisolvens]|jgi:ABC-2 type transport system ATP-binding protein|uniref:ABC transporter ATP-binding protein n=1 Tax=Acetivibrio straminisolvens TaxID=253314 RepID=UPI0022400B7F|nr:ABC transporter ATP-binding protein [Acetivibrio straminisolvens]
MDIIQVTNLKKYYGKHLGIENVSFSVKKGEILGFVGPNGAGKSTTIRILLNFIFPNGGNATICGKDVVKESHEIKKFTGYVPSDVRFYGDMTVKELIRVSNDFYDGSHDKEAERLCNLFELNNSKKFYELSTGNKKKAAIICALAAKPKVLILDEPTNGLDPMMQKRLFAELKNQSANGASILLSSHNLGEVQEYCHRVAFIKQGKILAITDLKEMRHPHKIITTIGGKDIIHPSMELLEQGEVKRTFRYKGDSALLLKLLQEASPDDFTVNNESLEERFMNLYGMEE